MFLKHKYYYFGAIMSRMAKGYLSQTFSSRLPVSLSHAHTVHHAVGDLL